MNSIPQIHAAGDGMVAINAVCSLCRPLRAASVRSV